MIPVKDLPKHEKLLGIARIYEMSSLKCSHEP